MPSPFPGMNPYLEQAELWQDFHLEFLPAIRRHLVRQLGSRYIVKLEEHLYIHDLPPEPRYMIGRSDVSVALSEDEPHVRGEVSVGVLDAPAKVQTPDLDIERVPFLEIRDRTGRELITVLELLSPSNKKSGEDREQYLAKRRELLRSDAHLVEIDLLRGGVPMPLKNRPECDYSVMISRVPHRPDADLWGILLANRLPRVPIPLRAPDEDAQLDLQAILDEVYDSAGYANYIYNGEPDPPLDPAGTEWARQFLPSRS